MGETPDGGLAEILEAMIASEDKAWALRQPSELLSSRESSSQEVEAMLNTGDLVNEVRSRDGSQSGHSRSLFKASSRTGSSEDVRSCLAGSREGSMHGRSVSFSDLSGANLTDDPHASLPRHRRPSLETAARSDRDQSVSSSRPPQLRGLMSLGRRDSDRPTVPASRAQPRGKMTAPQNEVTRPPAVAAAASFHSPAFPQLIYSPAQAVSFNFQAAPPLPLTHEAAPALARRPQSQAAPPIMHSQGAPPPAAMRTQAVPYAELTSQDLWANAMEHWESHSVPSIHYLNI